MTSMAQTPCVPGTLTSPKNAYILPDSATNLVQGCQGQNYEQIMYIKAAKDTVITITSPISGVLTADIDSFVINSTIGGMPAYLNVESVPAPLLAAGAASPKSNFTRLVIPGDSLACVKISGMIPTGAATGINNLNISLRVYTSNIHSADLVLDALIPTLYPGRKTDTLTSIGDYKIVINPIPCWPLAIDNMTAYGFQLIGNTPNPFSQSTQIKFESSKSDNYSIKLTNLLGEVVYHANVEGKTGLNIHTIQATSLSNGIYMYSINNGKNQLTGKMQVAK
jgi:hypothetical protein